ncbi:MAG: hypothetical protein ACRD1X_03455 [Vicinamibacteria bacterium]
MTSFFKANAWVAVSVMAALHLASCTTPDTLEQDTTNTLIVVELVQGAQGSPTGSPSDELESDVCTLTQDEVTGESFCTIAADYGIVQMSAVLKNQNQLNPTFLNDVTITSYRVTYTRSDGRNTPGVDVPYPFDGGTNFLVTVGGSDSTRAFILVRIQAKLEPPLVNMSGGGGASALSAIAEIQFFGHDGAGRPISAKGFLNIHFADFADQ